MGQQKAVALLTSWVCDALFVFGQKKKKKEYMNGRKKDAQQWEGKRPTWGDAKIDKAKTGVVGLCFL